MAMLNVSYDELYSFAILKICVQRMYIEHLTLCREKSEAKYPVNLVEIVPCYFYLDIKQAWDQSQWFFEPTA